VNERRLPRGPRKPSPAPVRGAGVRAEAARALARVVFDGVSLRRVLVDSNPRIADSRDRALLAASLFEASRWWLRHDAAMASLVDKPLPPKAREARALLVIAAVQIDVLGLPDYAVVAPSVEAMRVLGLGQYAGLANALLRRYARERVQIGAHLDQEAVTRSAHPRWLIDAFARDWPERAAAILEANNSEAALTLRVNRRRSTREDLLTRFAAEAVVAVAHDELADAIVLERSGDVTRLPGYAEGAFSVQDGAAQRVADLLDARDGQHVLDACAAPGGKSAHLLERADVDLVALDSDPTRLPRVRENLDRLGLAATIVAGDALAPAAWWNGRPFQRILIDAPCSASGIVRRQPDIKLHRRAGDIAPLVRTQREIVAALWPLLAPGGRLLYATCSVLRAENETVLAGFLADHDDARALPLPGHCGHAAGVGRQNLPGEGGMDGFYYALLEKNA